LQEVFEISAKVYLDVTSPGDFVEELGDNRAAFDSVCAAAWKKTVNLPREAVVNVTWFGVGRRLNYWVDQEAHSTLVGRENLSMTFSTELTSQEASELNLTQESIAETTATEFPTELASTFEETAVLQYTNITLVGVYLEVLEVQEVFIPIFMPSTVTLTMTIMTTTTETSTSLAEIASTTEFLAEITSSMVTQTSTSSTFSSATTTFTTATSTTSTDTTTVLLPPPGLDTGTVTDAAASANYIFFVIFGLCACICCFRRLRVKFMRPTKGKEAIPALGQEHLSAYTVDYPSKLESFEEGQDDAGKIHVVWHTPKSEVEDFFKRTRASDESSWSCGDVPDEMPGSSLALEDIGVNIVAASGEVSEDEVSVATAAPELQGEEERLEGGRRRVSPGALEGAGGWGLDPIVVSPLNQIMLPDSAYLLYDNGADVEYFSTTNWSWLRGSLKVTASAPEVDGGAIQVAYHVTVTLGQGRYQVRDNAVPATLRAPFRTDEPVEVFSRRRGGEWVPGRVHGRHNFASTSLGYCVRLQGGDGAVPMVIDHVPPHRVRRRFAPGSKVEVYRGLALGWRRARVADGAAAVAAHEAAAAANGLVGAESPDLMMQLTPRSTLTMQLSPRSSPTGSQGPFPGSPLASPHGTMSFSMSPSGASTPSESLLYVGTPQSYAGTPRSCVATPATPDSDPGIRFLASPWTLVPVEIDGEEATCVPSYFLRRAARRAFSV